MFNSPDKVTKGLSQAGYLADGDMALIVYLAYQLEKPLLIEGPAGVGKTELAKALAGCLGRELIRLQCYEGLDESKALYEWNYPLQLLRIQANHLVTDDWEQTRQNLFSSEFLLPRPLLKALSATKPVMLLIDEVDKSDQEFESFLLEALSDFQVSIPELGTVQACHKPFVILTSNNFRELSDALKRRCLHLYLDFPSRERELEIINLKLPDIDQALAMRAVEFVQSLRHQRLKKAPSISETLDWVQALILMGVKALTPELVGRTLPLLLKHRPDQVKIHSKVRELLQLGGNR